MIATSIGMAHGQSTCGRTNRVAATSATSATRKKGGIVARVIHEEDGDDHVDLALDVRYRSLLDPGTTPGSTASW